MRAKMVWTPKQDATIREMRDAGASLDAIAEIMQCARSSIIKRAKILGIRRVKKSNKPQFPRHVAGADPLKAGHKISWRILHRGLSTDEGDPDEGEAAPVLRTLRDRIEDSGNGGDRAMATAVVALAWTDAFGNTAGAGADNHPEERMMNISRAVEFLTAKSGAWGESREIWCDFAGVNPHALRDRALTALGLAMPPSDIARDQSA